MQPATGLFVALQMCLILLGVLLLHRERRRTVHTTGQLIAVPRCSARACVLRFRYQWAGRWQEGAHVVRLVDDSDRPMMRSPVATEEHWINRTVTIHLDPRDPVRSASLVDDDWRAVGGVLLILGVGGLVLLGAHVHHRPPYPPDQDDSLSSLIGLWFADEETGARGATLRFGGGEHHPSSHNRPIMGGRRG